MLPFFGSVNAPKRVRKVIDSFWTGFIKNARDQQ